MSATKAKFCIGHLIHHKHFDYRGIIVGVDLEFKNSDEWYDKMAKSRPRRDQAWYHVRVHNGANHTYVAERNLEVDQIILN